MRNRKHITLWTVLFFLCSCTDLSRNCIHLVSQRWGGWLRTGQPSSEDINEADNDKKPPAQITGTQPQRLEWKNLNGILYERKWSEKFQQTMVFPAFTPSLLRMKGKEYFISGYMIPLDTDNGLYALSKTTYSSCYFCGQGGPETIISVKLKKKPRRPYANDYFCTIRGTLDLNNTDDQEFILIFRNAEEYKP
ncbi:MAG: hypothetical protein QM664_04315 [Flavihumibacter sp.]